MRLVALVVVLVVEDELVVPERVPGEGAGALLDVVLGVVADAQAEQLHELAGEVLVGAPDARVVVVEVGEHRGVADDPEQQVGEAAQRVRAEQLVLHVHVVRVLDRAVAGREVVVPEERHLLFERARRLDHALEPPPLDVADLLAVLPLPLLALQAEPRERVLVATLLRGAVLAPLRLAHRTHDVRVEPVRGGGRVGHVSSAASR
jgi:hypothetical protein